MTHQCHDPSKGYRVSSDIWGRLFYSNEKCPENLTQFNCLPYGEYGKYQ